MNVERYILARVFVIPFYQANATLFLFIAVMAGGFMSAVEHVALASLFVSTPLSMLAPIAVWALYTLKVLRFNQALLQRAENTFMQHYCLLPVRAQWVGWLSTVAVQLLPAIGYGIFLVLMALRQKAWMSFVMVLLALVVLVFFVVALLYRERLYSHRQHSPSRLRRFLDKTFVRPYSLFFIEWIVRRQPLLLFGTKAFGCLLLLSVVYLYTDEAYDSRLLIMGITVVAAANLQLVWELLQFEHVHFSIVRQLPLSFGRRIMYTSVTLFALLLPEVGLIITYLPANLAVMEAIASVVYLLAGVILFYGILHRRDRAPEQLGGFAFAWVIGSVVLTLFQVPPLVLGAVNLFIGLYCWTRYFYQFEQRVEN
ncbi:hypothetical protein KK062_20510 [Fulvivirgaceae bacterium PWU5]|uniref:Uncharacterized protein n=1 Tax=Dawidia cretensis TaxID=2782350 RepID=A0AAP2E0Q9_9BACT|nr:hypothetical protein [Dawidia cretensis]MBT1710635.1 hypothetical protein [Dawidia cretensis]